MSRLREDVPVMNSPVCFTLDVWISMHIIPRVNSGCVQLCILNEQMHCNHSACYIRCKTLGPLLQSQEACMYMYMYKLYAYTIMMFDGIYRISFLTLDPFFNVFVDFALYTLCKCNAHA